MKYTFRDMMRKPHDCFTKTNLEAADKQPFGNEKTVVFISKWWLQLCCLLHVYFCVKLWNFLSATLRVHPSVLWLSKL